MASTSIITVQIRYEDQNKQIPLIATTSTPQEPKRWRGDAERNRTNTSEDVELVLEHSHVFWLAKTCRSQRSPPSVALAVKFHLSFFSSAAVCGQTCASVANSARERFGTVTEIPNAEGKRKLRTPKRREVKRHTCRETCMWKQIEKYVKKNQKVCIRKIIARERKY